jgi:hypothetical protein
MTAGKGAAAFAAAPADILALRRADATAAAARAAGRLAHLRGALADAIAGGRSAEAAGLRARAVAIGADPTRLALEAAAAAAQATGGATIDDRGLPVVGPGFVVASALGTAFAVAAGRADSARLAADAAEDLLAAGAPAVGYWVSPAGQIEVDPVEVVADLAEALRLGRERRQAAVYDLGAGEVVFV